MARKEDYFSSILHQKEDIKIKLLLLVLEEVKPNYSTQKGYKSKNPKCDKESFK